MNSRQQAMNSFGKAEKNNTLVASLALGVA
jgi:hypothetical protein